MNLKEIRRTKDTITLGWDPPNEGTLMGYAFLSDGYHVSHSWDPELKETTFSIPEGENPFLTVIAIGALDQGIFDI